VEIEQGPPSHPLSPGEEDVGEAAEGLVAGEEPKRQAPCEDVAQGVDVRQHAFPLPLCLTKQGRLEQILVRRILAGSEESPEVLARSVQTVRLGPLPLINHLGVALVLT